VKFTDGRKARFGAEPICRVLSEHGCPIAPSTYYDAARRAPSARAGRDERLKAAITRVHQDNYGGLWGPQGVAIAQPGGQAGGPVNGRAADAPARAGRRPPRPAGPHHQA
jgi:hypothetical protein